MKIPSSNLIYSHLYIDSLSGFEMGCAEALFSTSESKAKNPVEYFH